MRLRSILLAMCVSLAVPTRCAIAAAWSGHGPSGGSITVVLSMPETGLVYAAAQHDFDATRSFGQLYRSADGGETWSAVGDGLTASAITTIAASRFVPETIYLGTRTDGVFKSTDSGLHWKPANTGLHKETPYYSIPIWSIVVDPLNPVTVYLVYGGVGAGGYPDGGSGIVYKSTNGGESWQLADNLGLPISNLIRDPSSANVLYASHFNGPSRSADGGMSWERINSSLSPLVDAIGLNFLSPGVLYLGTSSQFDTNGGFHQGGFFRSQDSGTTWNAAGTGLPSFDPGPGFTALAVDPVSPGTLYAGLWSFLSSGTGLYKTTDGGSSWQDLQFENGPSGFNYIRSIEIDRRTPDTLYVGTARHGLHKSTDGGLTWSSKNRGIANSVVTSVAVDPLRPGTVYAGIRFGISKTENGGLTWNALELGVEEAIEIVDVLVDPGSPNTVYAASNDGHVGRSTDAGATWSFVSAGLEIRRMIADPFNPETLYAAGGYYGDGVRKSTDGGQTWTSAGMSDIRVEALVADPLVPQTLYAGAAGGAANGRGVFKSTDGGASWTLVGLGDYGIGDLIVDPSVPATVYASAGSLYKSTDSGQSWTAVGEANGSRLALDPTTAGGLYETTAFGVRRSRDGGATWANVTGEPLPEPVSVVAPDLLAPNRVWVGTYGLGVLAVDAQCGDGILDASEQCDDGPITGTAASCCSSACQAESPGALCSGGVCDGSGRCSCGNGSREATEECDDGNRNDEDSCTNACLTNSCGDARMHSGVEQCDDGTGNGTDSSCCSGACTFKPAGTDCDAGNCGATGSCVSDCGNGTVEDAEECDDGNASENDSCRSACVLNVCGDGVVDRHAEQCDDGALADGDGCSATCEIEPDTVTRVVGPDDSVSTDAGADPTTSRPLQLAVISPTGGAVTISRGSASPDATTGFSLLGAAAEIDAPAATASSPLVITFRFDASIIPQGQRAGTIDIRKDGQEVDPCTGPMATPDPCVAARDDLPGGGVRITVFTSSASVWSAVADTCGAIPSSGCKQAGSGKSRLLLKTGSTAAQAQLSWQWKNGAATSIEDIVDSGAPTSFALCIYEDVGAANPRTRMSGLLPGPADCGEAECWAARGGTFKFRSHSRIPSGLGAATIVTGDDGRAKLSFKGKGELLGLETLSLAPPVVVQLRRTDDGACWEAAFSHPTVSDENELKARSD